MRFVSYAPYDEPEISVVVVVPNGHSSGNAAQIAKDVYKLYYNLEDKEQLLDEEASAPNIILKPFLIKREDEQS